MIYAIALEWGSSDRFGNMAFFSFLTLHFLGVPIAVALKRVTILSLGHFQLGIPVVSSNFYAGIAKYPLLAVPFFILAGMILEHCCVS
ncbi:MAG: TRAP transporter large permease subunit [Desulfosoma sp.]